MSVIIGWLPMLLVMAVIFGGAVIYIGTRDGRTENPLKNQWVAWTITGCMIVLSVVIGLSGANANRRPEPSGPVDLPGATAPLQGGDAQNPWSGFIRDRAGVLSPTAVQALEEQNLRMGQEMNVVIAVVTGNQIGNLFQRAMMEATVMDLGGYDFILLLDIEGRSGLLVQGDELSSKGWFTDEDCSEYMSRYVQDDFNRGNYDQAVLALTEALEQWYRANY